MTRINAIRNTAETNSVAWGKQAGKRSGQEHQRPRLRRRADRLLRNRRLFQRQTETRKLQQPDSGHATAARQPMPAPVMQAENKPAPKKVVHKKPATVNYTDKTYGVTFEYPRRYAIETGDAASRSAHGQSRPDELRAARWSRARRRRASRDRIRQHRLLVRILQRERPQDSHRRAMQRVRGAAAQGSDARARASSAVPQPTHAEPGPAPAPTRIASNPRRAMRLQITNAAEVSRPLPSTRPSSNSKLLLGDLELRATEAVSGEGTRQSDSKYFHVYQNGSCYEFALNVTTVASEEGLIKHVDRDKVFSRLEQILSTVKINPVDAPEVTAETPSPTPAATPAQSTC